MIKVKDIVISDDILTIVSEEVDRIKMLGMAGREAADLVRLEKVAKVYALMMSSTRENTKAGIYGKMSTEDLEKLDAQLGGAEEADDADADLDGDSDEV